jgi:uncharacterized protein (TIGR04222 family)
MRLRRFAAASAAATLLLLAGSTSLAAPAHAQPGDVIESFGVDIDVRADGSFHVREEIDYTFGPGERRGIFRYLQTRYDIEAEPKFERVIEIDDIQVSSPTGAPTAKKISTEGPYKVVRIGDEDERVSGSETYVLDYEVRGAMNGPVNGFEYAELAWDATGNGWDAPITRVDVSVSGPEPLRQACFAGSAGSSRRCSTNVMTDGVATFGHDGLGPAQGVTVVVGYDPALIAVPAPVTEERWSFGRAFTRNGLPLGAALLALVAGLGAVGWVVWSRGRDRRYVGQVPGLTPMGDEIAVEERKPLGRDNVVVNYELPKDARPAEVGTLIDESADVLDVTATLVDLAVRGFLRIDELPATGLIFKKHDWKLVKLKEGDDTLRRYERTLFDALFAGRSDVTLSDLKQTFADDLNKVQDQLYDEVVYNRWFRRRPDTTRTTWLVFGVVLAAAGVALTVWLAQSTRYGLLGVAVTVVGLTLLVSGRFMPARTGRGSAALAQSLGFRQYIRTAEAEQIRFEERESVFSRYLPYAIVFGEAERWAKTFASLAAVGGAAGAAGVGYSPGLHSLYWYGAAGGFDADSFSDAITSFADTTSGSIAAAAPSSSSGSGFGGGGFSGGGFGGGGGGSW